ncbi:MAG: zinc ribbon domain-containing protein [Pseudomonadota bacterium]
MPTYEYLCKDCGHQFELVERMSEHAAAHKCPKCRSEKVEPRVAVFFAKTSRKSRTASKYRHEECDWDDSFAVCFSADQIVKITLVSKDQ